MGLNEQPLHGITILLVDKRKIDFAIFIECQDFHLEFHKVHCRFLLTSDSFISARVTFLPYIFSIQMNEIILELPNQQYGTMDFE